MTQAERVLAECSQEATEQLFERAGELRGLYSGGYIYFEDDSTLKLIWDGETWTAQSAINR